MNTKPPLGTLQMVCRPAISDRPGRFAITWGCPHVLLVGDNIPEVTAGYSGIPIMNMHPPELTGRPPRAVPFGSDIKEFEFADHLIHNTSMLFRENVSPSGTVELWDLPTNGTLPSDDWAWSVQTSLFGLIVWYKHRHKGSDNEHLDLVLGTKKTSTDPFDLHRVVLFDQKEITSITNKGLFKGMIAHGPTVKIPGRHGIPCVTVARYVETTLWYQRPLHGETVLNRGLPQLDDAFLQKLKTQ